MIASWKRWPFALALAASSLAPHGPVQAQSATNPPPAATQPVARSAFIRAMDAEFARMDSDKSGQVTQVEIEVFQNAAQLLHYKRRNTMLFTTLDADRNGQISAAEFAALVPKKSVADGRPMLARWDANRDTKVTGIEYRAATLANFDKLDTDKDGFASQAEMRAGGIAK